MRIENKLHTYETVTQRTDGFESLDYVVNKAAEISIRMFSFFSFFCDQCRFLTPRAVFIFSADSGIDEQ